MPGFDNGTMYADNVDFTGGATPAPTVTLDGQLLIGSTAAPNIRVATLTAGANISIVNGAGTITIAATGGGAGTVSGLTPDAFTGPGSSPVIPNGGGNIIITGAQVAAGVVGTNVIRTDSLAANTMTIEIQRATSAAVSTPASNGVSHFDNTSFTVGAGGFVTLIGGAGPSAQKFNIDTTSGTGVDPVVPTALGVVTITGGQVAAGTVGANVIRTDSPSPNTYAIEIQRSTTAAASTTASNGVSHFDNTIFTVDAGGFVSLVGGAVPPAQKFDVDNNVFPGTDPVVANGSGVIVFSGAQVAAGTIATGIWTNSIAANAMRVEVQRSTMVAGTDPTKNGISHFNVADFSVDANGFVSLSASTPIAAAMAFLSTNDVSVTGNGASYTLGSGGALTIAFDNGGNMTTGGIFTAPTTGKYMIGAELLFDNLTVAMTICNANLRTTLGVYPFGYCNPGAVMTGGGGAGSTLYSISGQVLANMTAGNTFTVDCQIQGGAGNTANVNGVGSRRVNMYAYLVSAP